MIRGLYATNLKMHAEIYYAKMYHLKYPPNIKTLQSTYQICSHMIFLITSYIGNFVCIVSFDPGLVCIAVYVFLWISNWGINSVRPSDAYMRQETNHNWFR